MNIFCLSESHNVLYLLGPVAGSWHLFWWLQVLRRSRGPADERSAKAGTAERQHWATKWLQRRRRHPCTTMWQVLSSRWPAKRVLVLLRQQRPPPVGLRRLQGRGKRGIKWRRRRPARWTAPSPPQQALRPTRSYIQFLIPVIHSHFLSLSFFQSRPILDTFSLHPRH